MSTVTLIVILVTKSHDPLSRVHPEPLSAYTQNRWNSKLTSCQLSNRYLGPYWVEGLGSGGLLYIGAPLRDVLCEFLPNFKDL